jgi:RNA polymerase sigma factor (sigma-70 family)
MTPVENERRFAINARFANDQNQTSYENNQALMVKLANDYCKSLARSGLLVDFDDMMQEMRSAWLVAVSGFKPELGNRFSTYFVRVAFTHMRKLMESERRNTRDLGLVSIDSTIGDSELSLSDILATDELDPETALIMEQQAEGILRSLSDRAREVVNWLLNPPEALLQELRAMKHKASMSQSGRRVPSMITLGLACEYSTRLHGLGRRDYFKLLQELKAVYE